MRLLFDECIDEHLRLLFPDHDCQTVQEYSFLHCSEYLNWAGDDGVLVLPFQSQDDDPCVLCRTICPDVAKIKVQCDQYAILLSRPVRNHRIVRSHEALISDGVGLKSSRA